MDYQVHTEVKKNRLSFIGKLFRTSKKSNKKNDDSFQRQNSLYHSFHCTNAPPNESDEREDFDNFTTLEDSAFKQMHSDAGIIFLNRNNHVCDSSVKEEDSSRHVQFVPTPQNKYYRVDRKKPLTKRIVSNGENKENLDQSIAPKPSRSILRLAKSRENLSISRSEQPLACNRNLADVDKVKVNVSYVEGPEVKKTPVMQRTSTKLFLVDHKNGSLPRLNVSNITKYGSLPRNTQMYADNLSGDIPKVAMRVNKHQQLSNATQVPEQAGFRRRFEPKVNQYGCRSIPNIPKLIEHKGYHQPYNRGISQRLSLRDSSMHGSVSKESNVNSHCYDRNKDLGTAGLLSASQMKKAVQNPFAKIGGSAALPINRTTSYPSKVILREKGLPNQAINQVGLPIINAKKSEFGVKNQRSRSESPHYIPLSETYSQKRSSTSSQTNKPSGPAIMPSEMQKEFKKPSYDFRKSTLSIQTYPVSHPHGMPFQVHTRSQGNTIATKSLSNNNLSRKQATRENMYSQKRQFLNKICKYRSKECEDGFSSMADDECSFNCSCSSCMSRLSKSYKCGKTRQALPEEEEDDKFFFVLTESNDLNQGWKLESVPEGAPSDNESIPPVEKAKMFEEPEKGTWYECNDSLCKTPAAVSSALSNETVSQTNKPEKEEEQHGNVYENFTDLINSETKRNFKPQDVEKMFSTPIMKSKFKQILTESGSKKINPKALFTPENDGLPEKPVYSPAKSPIVFSDSVILLQEIFQKLSQECRDLLRPNTALKSPAVVPQQKGGSDSKYVCDLVKNLQTTEISESYFADIIGGIAQNIFLEAKSKRHIRKLIQSASLPDLSKENNTPKPEITSASSLKCIGSASNSIFASTRDEITILDSDFKTEVDVTDETVNDVLNEYSAAKQSLKDWSLPSENDGSAMNSSKNDSRNSESDMQLLENAIRLGMGLSPIQKVNKAACYSASPAKATKYKSKDVLSGKGKLKLKVYHNSGLVTVHIIKGSKLQRLNSKELNPYVKVSMVPDTSKRVHWRTTVKKGHKNPFFNQKFSFEVLTEDWSKRIVFSVWHRDITKERSELIGCMSFSVNNIMDNSYKINGWYRLLREGFGTQKHFAAHAKKTLCSGKTV